MATAARVLRSESAHWYTKTGHPCFEIPKKGGGGNRAPNVKDAREMHLVPSVTGVLKVINKPNLNSWKEEQAVLAVLSTPRKPGEALDEFVHRVLQKERVQEQEADKARKLGSDIHDAIEKAMYNHAWDQKLAPYVEPIIKWRMSIGNVIWAEQILVGNGYAGKADLLMESEQFQALMLTDFKTTGTLPKASYDEHRLQTAAYAAAVKRGNPSDSRPIWTTNVYISTKEPGQFVVHSQHDWMRTFLMGFKPILEYWQWANNYFPEESQ